MIALPSTASTVEIVWTALSVPGLALSVYNTVGACRDIRYHWRDGLRGVGWIGLVKVATVLAMCLLLLVAGLASILAPPPLRPEVQHAADVLATCLLILDALALVLAVAFCLERRYVVPHVHVLRDRG